MREIHKQTNQLSDLAKSVNSSYLRSMAELANGVSPLFQLVAQNQRPLLDFLKEIQEQTRPYQEAFKQLQIVQDSWRTAGLDALRDITEAMRGISADYYLRIKLRSQYWLIVDEDLIDKLSENNAHEREEVTPIVIDYYKASSWQRLEALVHSWTPYISEDRLDFFKAFVHLAKKIENGDSHKATVPAIIAHIDGLVRELRSILPTDIKTRIKQEVIENLPVELKEKRVDVRDEVTVHVIAEVIDFWSADMLQEVVFGGLFRDSRDINPEESYLLFRHKIMHGDNAYLFYGTEENFVRLMLCADFIVQLIKRIKEHSTSTVDLPPVIETIR